MAKRNQLLTWGVPIVVILIAVALIAYVLGKQQSSTETQPAQTQTNAPVQGPSAPSSVQQPARPDYAALERRIEGDPLAIGAIDAPVVLVGFSDYQCQFCAKWSNDTLPALQPYVNAGDLRIEWYDVSIFGEDSHRAALAAYAAGQQGQFWQYHARLFPNGGILDASDLTEDALIEHAAELGLDTDQFAADLASDEVRQAVEANMSTGLEYGVFSTPSFTINGQPIVGAQPTPVFTDAVEAAISAG
ncbi:protein-disulfide isomerase [Trueperella bonasi]|uniref:Protein-disulfide isomerase n=1 Tax=Trueperella bonasi TaxID=312286 RepID=A0ABT9NFB3_9ACTO|nr:thioredoxin domain-containing protein [Trueperella bonasi]MDP9806071.1 protein-disulfide isomerase [Trueperella bonasi]